jgi:hypothetical protein
MACGAGGKLTTDRAYSELKPKEKLPERELKDLPENLYIKISNVADAGRSYRNFVVLYVNGREVAPIEKMSNMLATYTYPLRLQHGVYDIKAEYHVVGFWQEQVFDILPDEPVKILPDQRAVMTCALDKDYKGRPAQTKVPFRLRYEDLPDPAASRPASTQVEWSAPPAKLLVEEVRSTPPPQHDVVKIVPEQAAEPSRVAPEPEFSPSPSARTVTLQINTTPSGADVTVDDRYLGQSPLKVAVTANQNHVVQLSRAGHQEVVKVIDARELRSEQVLQLLVKLEPVLQQ